MNRFLCEHKISFLYGQHPGVRLLDHIGSVCSIFQDTDEPFSKVAVSF